MVNSEYLAAMKIPLNSTFPGYGPFGHRGALRSPQGETRAPKSGETGSSRSWAQASLTADIGPIAAPYLY
jgi:hypothetical protein